MAAFAKSFRSILFMPGHKEKWIDGAPSSGADAVLLDLEDSVPAEAKTSARTLVARKIPELAAKGTRVYVRINRSPHLYDFEDILAVVQEGLEGLVLSKPFGPEDLYVASSMASEAELRNGVAAGHTRLLPTLETARSMQFSYEIALFERVDALGLGIAKNGDSTRSLGIQWTREGTESLYAWSRGVMAARAAGKQPIGGLWQDVHDIDGLRTFARRNRQIGFSGEMILHPTNVAVVNEVYSPSEDELRYYRGMIEAYDAAKAQGTGAVIYDGEHIDLAHVQTARSVLAMAATLSGDAVRAGLSKKE